MLTQQQLDEFKAIWLEEYDVALSDEEALSEAIGLLNFYEAVFAKGDDERLAELAESDSQ